MKKGINAGFMVLSLLSFIMLLALGALNAATVTFQAENASFGGSVVTETTNSGYLGTAYLNFPTTGGYVQFNNVDGGSGGAATLQIRSALGITTSRTGRYQVNGGAWQNITFNPTGAWTTWTTMNVSVTLNSGTGNTVRLESTGQDLANIDQLTVVSSGGGSSTPTPTRRVTPTPTQGGSGPIGFASLNALGQNGTTGGAGGQIVTVTTQAALESYAGAVEPYIIRVQGTIIISPFGKEVRVASNKTIIGVGNNATISQGGFILDPANNVIIRNLSIRDSAYSTENDYDAIQVDNSHHIWLDHLRLMNCGDGLIDLREATTYVTVSWCIFSNHDKTFGLGWTTNTEYKVTIHHNWFNGTNQRNPSFDNGIGHLYNNYMLGLTSYGNYSRGVARLVIENSWFENTKDPYYPDSGAQLVSKGNRVVNCTGKQIAQGTAFNPSDYYSYTLDPVDNVPTILRSLAGPQSNIQ